MHVVWHASHPMGNERAAVVGCFVDTFCGCQSGARFRQPSNDFALKIYSEYFLRHLVRRQTLLVPSVPQSHQAIT